MIGAFASFVVPPVLLVGAIAYLVRLFAEASR